MEQSMKPIAVALILISSVSLTVSAHAAPRVSGAVSNRSFGRLALPPKLGPNKIRHVIIIFQENRTPDNLFQGLPNADISSVGIMSRGLRFPLVPIPLTANFDIDHSHAAFVTAFNRGRMDGFDRERVRCGSGRCNATALGYVPPSEVQPYFA